MSVPLLPAALRHILEDLEMLPGIGPKSAQRICFYLLEQSPQYLKKFGNDLANILEGVRKCSVCGMLAEESVCKICSDPARNATEICVVESALDVIAIERIGEFRGVYHVLSGLLSPLDNVGPEDINIPSLIERVTSGHFSEIILALNPSTEGETTALYLRKIILKNKNEQNISRIAQGLPTGAAIEFADDLTISRAFSGRQILK